MPPLYKPKMSVRQEKSNIFVVNTAKPSIFSSSDYGTQHFSFTRTLGEGMLIGILGLTYPTTTVITVTT